MSLFIGEHYYKSFCVLVQIHIFSHILSGLLHGLSRKGAAGIHIHFFLKVVSRASIPKNMLLLAKFWLPFQKWRIIAKKRRQNGYMLKNLCFLLTSYDASLQYM